MKMSSLSGKKILFIGLVIFYSFFIAATLTFISGSDLDDTYIVGFFLIVVIPSFIIFPIMALRIFSKEKIEPGEKFRLVKGKNEY